MRTLDELIDRREPGWPVVEGWLAAAKNPVELLPVEPARAAEVLTLMQVTTRSPMGAIAYGSGGLVIDGWLRVLGGGGPRMRGDLARWNGLGGETLFGGVRGACVVALDPLGGLFALLGNTRKVSYFAPDALKWQPLALGYSEFVHSMLQSSLDDFWKGLRWPGWRDETKTLALDDGIQVYPPLWSKESPQGTPAHAVAPLRQLVTFGFDMASQLDG